MTLDLNTLQIRDPTIFNASDSTPLSINSTTFVEVLRLESDMYADHRVTWMVEADLACDICLTDESQHVYMTQGVSTPSGYSHNVHSGDANVHAREFRLMVRSLDGMPVTVGAREIRAVRLGVEHKPIDFHVLKSRGPQPPFGTAIDLLVASENRYKLDMGYGLSMGRTTSLFGGSGV